ncbi:glycosyltransferase family 1 protein [Sphingobium sp. HBC34]|uniref:Glycosyltransferase family 1 protein n=1 Tax=Sphingobium cyanobacteriorum TaxID=3063954 RepID=A0ABT8ZNA8_9SPHN|nr:glycosyltransferase family 1 protein [Sphingobium sp. HBC34]MDO7836022.1 glycosyltransferase family 1 protein [Sphingobium sp. HBC34]
MGDKTGGVPDDDDGNGPASDLSAMLRPRHMSRLSFPVCIDGRLLDDDYTGVGHYAARLAQTLARHGAAPLRLDAVPPAAGGGGVAARLGRYARATLPGARTVERLDAGDVGGFSGRLLGRDLFREAYLHFKFRGRLLPVRCPGAPGIMHWTYPLPLYLEGWRNIYTVHDIIPINRQDLSPVDGARLARLLGRIIERADRLVTVSEAVRQDVIARWGCAPDFVTACHQATDLDTAHDAAGAGARAHFLYYGAIEPRKNLVRLARAYRASGSGRPLLIVGQDGWRAQETRAMIGEGGNVRFLPLQSRDALTGLIRDARAMLFPSLDEGFGLPVAESMALGTPVMASSIPALREVAGDGALFVDPLDEAEMSRAIRALDRDDGLCARLRALGVAKAVAYQSSAYYERLHRIYADVGGAGAGRA